MDSCGVLILILMEHAQRVYSNMKNQEVISSLNPYFNGTCSKRLDDLVDTATTAYVLILILMEHAQRVSESAQIR